MQHLRPALVLITLSTLLLGLGFPLAFTGLATALVPDRANGSLIVRGGQVVGSSLIGQNVTSDRYFHSRPSATTATDPNDPSKTIPAPYNAASSNGSNLAPTSKALISRIAADAAEEPRPIPADAVTTSASGLDPDISPANALRQVERVAKSRGLPEDRVRALVAAHIDGRFLGFFGEPRVNVLALNLAVDEAALR